MTRLAAEQAAERGLNTVFLVDIATGVALL